MENLDTDPTRTSTAQQVPPARSRKLAKVPFLELSDGRLQGVVSSGSDIERVYVSSISAGDHGVSCSTNNNRPCGGLNTQAVCKHAQVLLTEAERQFGTGQVARYLRIEINQDESLFDGLHPTRSHGCAAEVFSSFLRHLAYLEVGICVEPLREMQWFPAGPATL